MAEALDETNKMCGGVKTSLDEVWIAKYQDSRTSLCVLWDQGREITNAVERPCFNVEYVNTTFAKLDLKCMRARQIRDP